MRQYFERLSMLATGVTVLAMFGGIVAFSRLESRLEDNELLLLGVGSALGSVTVYRLISRGLHHGFRSSQVVRRLVLGRSFLEGTWVGHYIAKDTERYTVEFVRQQDGEILLSGYELNEDGSPRADWTSEVAFLDPRAERFRYLYSCDVYERNNQHSGIGMFKVLRSDRGVAEGLVGYAVDMIDAEKDSNREVKISDKVLNLEDAFRRAKELFPSANRGGVGP